MGIDRFSGKKEGKYCALCGKEMVFTIAAHDPSEAIGRSLDTPAYV